MFTTMSSEGKPRRVEVIMGVQRQRRWTPSEKLALVQETYQAGKTLSLVAREAGITASQLFQWCKAHTVSATEMKEALRRIKVHPPRQAHFD